ncbi:MAG: PspA/IM30 family protein [Paracoccaceae bacterium]|nr:PspA/IM30 family protein [Paracoccaceae bacterium]
MFSTLRTLFDGANARADERLRDTYAVELIDQRIREAETNLAAAKTTLASLIQRQRAEQRLAEGLDRRIADVTERATEALKAKKSELAEEAAQAIADMENERTIRGETLSRLDTRVIQLRTSVETAHRRIVDLKQGAITARAIRREQAMQSRLDKTVRSSSAADEAETLIRRVVDQDDPFEQSQILRDIDRGLKGEGVATKLEDAGFGSATRSTAENVLDRLKKDL